jgi:hypothetical protein
MARLTNGGIIGKLTTTPTLNSAVGKWNTSDQFIYKYQNLWTIFRPTSVEYLIVAGGGGGGGGYQGGGGGAGGMLSGSTSVSTTSYTITVGTGGRGATNGSPPLPGNNSVAFGLTSIGGGNGSGEMQAFGASGSQYATSGGSGGGTGHSVYGAALAGTAGQGNAGGTGVTCCNSSGGGGAGGVGGNATSNTSVAGLGGLGLASSITGTSLFYAGGGAGCVRDSSTIYAGGSGVGGNGRGANLGAFQGQDGRGGGGGGGGGAQGVGGRGGNGVVIVAYPDNFDNLQSIGAGLTYTLNTTSRPGYKVYTFNAGTGFVSW